MVFVITESSGNVVAVVTAGDRKHEPKELRKLCDLLGYQIHWTHAHCDIADLMRYLRETADEAGLLDNNEQDPDKHPCTGCPTQCPDSDRKND